MPPNTLTRSIPGECNLYRGQRPSPIQGSFDLRLLGHYLFVYFLFLLRANLALLLITHRQNPLFGFPTPKPGNAPNTMKWTRDGGMEPFQFVAPPRGHATIRPYHPHQPSSPHRPRDFSIEERGQPAALNEPRLAMDPDVEEARRAH